MNLSAGETLLHIGTPKSGTTSIQAILGAKWRYQNLPGVLRYTTFNADHQLARELDNQGSTATIEAVTKLKSEKGDEFVSLITSERFSRFDIDAVARTKELIGANTRVVISMRSFESYFPSMWQQTIKRGATISLDDWLRAYFDGIPHPGMRVFHEDDGFNLVTRWAEIFGPENLSVVVTSKKKPELIADAFGKFLSLALSTSELNDSSNVIKNRSLSNLEIFVLRKINQRYQSGNFSQVEYDEVILNATRALQNARSLGADESVPRSPEWAQGPISELASKYAQTINRLNIQVIGEISELASTSTPETPPAATPPAATSTEIETALDEIQNFYDREIEVRSAKFSQERSQRQSSGAKTPAWRRLIKSLIQKIK
jgi:hypothetical protein